MIIVTIGLNAGILSAKEITINIKELNVPTLKEALRIKGQNDGTIILNPGT